MIVRRTLAGLITVLLALAVPASGALAASSTGSSAVSQLPGTTSPFSPGVPQSAASIPSTNTTPAVSGTSTSPSDSGLSGSGAILVAAGAIILLGGIAFFIWRDARRHAPARAGAGHGAPHGDVGDRGHRSGSKAPPKPRKLSAAERKRRKRGRAR